MRWYSHSFQGHQAGNAFVNALSIKKSFASHIKQALAQTTLLACITLPIEQTLNQL